MTKTVKGILTENNRSKWIYLIFGVLIMMCLGTVYSYSVLRLSVERQYGVGSMLGGLPYMTSLAFYAIFMFIAGRHLERFDPRMVLITGGLLVSLGWILSAFAPSIYALTLTYGVISGAGVGIAYGVPMTAVSKWFPERKGLFVGLVLVGFGLSPVVTAPLLRQMVEVFGLHSTFLAIGASFGVLIPLLSLPFRYPQLENRKIEAAASITNPDSDTRDMVRSKGFKALYLNFFIGSMIGLMMVGMTTTAGTVFIGLTPSEVTSLIILFALFNGAGRPVFGFLTDRFSSRKAMLLSYSLILVASLIMLTAKEGDNLKYAVSFSIFWFNLGGWLAIAPASTSAMFGSRSYSRNYGVVFTAYGIGAIAGVLASGLLLDIFGNLTNIFYFVASLCMFGMILTLRLFAPAVMKASGAPIVLELKDI
ncbi:OFA family MFS transporter [Youngiibacter multivorans]|uniref:MFS family permease n=1 Tax=Youngiibacter multivorans TaxID=937251 RepID=A0ABS4G0G8_9CLOT|nr:OFA family MFS transporter [Youngiibacter multivorans]MBP1918034.1 MFS family permease [Youngiibacter multivorans]